MNIPEVVKQIEKKYGRPVMAVYLRGSRLRNLEREDSDYDITCIIKPTKVELLNNFGTSDRIRLPDLSVEGNVIDIPQLFQHISKGNPTTLEMIHLWPVYLDESAFGNVARFLHKNRGQWLQNPIHLKNVIKMSKYGLGLTSNRGRYHLGVLSLLHGEAVLNGQNFDKFVPINKTQFERELQRERTVVLQRLRTLETTEYNGKIPLDLCDQLESILFAAIVSVT